MGFLPGRRFVINGWRAEFLRGQFRDALTKLRRYQRSEVERTRGTDIPRARLNAHGETEDGGFATLERKTRFICTEYSGLPTPTPAVFPIFHLHSGEPRRQWWRWG